MSEISYWDLYITCFVIGMIIKTGECFMGIFITFIQSRFIRYKARKVVRLAREDFENGNFDISHGGVKSE